MSLADHSEGESAPARPRVGEPWHLPQGWLWSVVYDAIQPVSTKDPKRIFKSDLFIYIDLSAIRQGKIEKIQQIPGDNAPSRARQLVNQSDTLFSCVRVYLENITLVPSEYDGAIASTAYCVLRPSNIIDSRYLNYFVRSPPFISWTTKLQRGNSPPAVLDSDVKAQALPLAPLAEQRRIVARIDALFAEIEDGERASVEAREGLETFRRALLKVAVSGELTRDWRVTNSPAESGREFATRIAAERAVNPSGSGRGRRRSTSTALDPTGLPTLPETWVWARLEDLVTAGPTNGYSPKTNAEGDGTLSLKLTATTKGWIDLAPRSTKVLAETISSASDLFLTDGDLLFQRGNTIEYVGIAAVYRGPPRTYIYPDLMIRVRTNHPELTEWLWRVANSPYGRKYMADRATGTAGTMPKISGETLRAFPVPLPPMAEMIEILRRISGALSANSDTLGLLDAATADAARLKQSILKAAFEGRLVPQDPTDEPAAAMLARLKPSADDKPRRSGRPRAAARSQP